MNDSIGVGDLLAIVTGAGLAIYVAGLVGLALAINLRFTHNISTAWYAVSLLPRTVVAGQGIKIWLLWPTALPMGPILLVWLSVPFDGPKGVNLILILAALLIELLLLIGFNLRELLLALWNLRTQRYPDQRYRVWVLMIMTGLPTLTIALTGLILSGTGAILTIDAVWGTQYSASLLTLPVVEAENRLLAGVLLILVGGFLIGILSAAGLDLPLTMVEVDRKPGVENERVPTPLVGYLATHSDGFWHLFDGNESLLAIPDEQVLAVRTLSSKWTRRSS